MIKQMRKINTNSNKYIYEFKDIEVLVEVKNIKGIYLKVDSNSNIKMSVPKSLHSEKRVKEFLNEKYDWIKKSVSKQQKRKDKKIDSGEDITALNLEQGDKIKVLGKDCYITSVNKIPNGKHALIDKKQSVIYVKNDLNKIQRYDAIYKELRNEIYLLGTKLIAKWEIILDIKSNSLKITSGKGNWGSCNTKKRYINLNIGLVHKNISEIEYVVLHELAHLFYANHGKEFKALLTKHMPDWKERKKKLNNKNV